ncbi:MAG: M48 family peptidase [Actinobacteria bacterium]|nr:MAG: M48 family peptidase [Actinomycetota bacterium]
MRARPILRSSGGCRLRPQSPSICQCRRDLHRFGYAVLSLLDFSQEDRERAARYHRPLYAAVGLRLLIVLAVFGAFTQLSFGGLGWLGGALVWPVVVLASVGIVCLPLDAWRGLVRERRFGLSTQTAGGWLADRAKGEAVELVLAALVWAVAVGLGRALPRWWPVPAAAGLALLVLVLSFVAPVVLEPLFNRFRPLDDERLAAELRALADRAGVPVRDVLVADASRRTTRTNAYVSGLGPTRRVVVWDTLLAEADERELKLILAHELGHRRERHVLQGTLLAMAGAVAAVVVLWAAIGAPAPGDFPLAALLFTGLELVALPAMAATSRRWERVADRWSLELTGDRDAFARAHVSLARKNLSDLDPPRLAYVFLFTHPTPPERLALAEGRGV